MSFSDKTGIAVFASGTGSNARKIMEYFAGHATIEVRAVVTNNPAAGVLAHAHHCGVPSLVITRSLLADREWFSRQLTAFGVERIVLAGFLLLIPEYLTREYSDRIVNIHPALLPLYGGKGMYGMHVHDAVKAAGESRTGITIHLVNERFDEGRILFQKDIAVESADTPESIAQKVHLLEHAWYPQVIEKWIQGTL